MAEVQELSEEALLPKEKWSNRALAGFGKIKEGLGVRSIVTHAHNPEVRRDWYQSLESASYSPRQSDRAYTAIEEALKGDIEEEINKHSPIESSGYEDEEVGILIEKLKQENPMDYFQPGEDGKRKLFPIGELVTDHVPSIRVLYEKLKGLKGEARPREEGLIETLEIPEFVPVDKIIGGVGIENWANVSQASNRGIERVYSIVRGIQRGRLDITGPYDPINIRKVGDEYYIDKQGRHRVAALKALGVPFAPMLVRHFVPANTNEVISKEPPVLTSTNSS
ncbi:MAG TPA: hypothetical protein VNA13_05060 [Xanthomonadales bacterium]|nr:hypothetical protein [Xanthomonadales bacterium]